MIDRGGVVTGVKIAYFVERYRGFRTYVYEELNNLKTFTPIFLAEEMWNQNYLFPELKIFSKSNLSWLGRLKGGYFKRVLLAEGVRLIRAYFGHGGIRMLPVSKKLNIPLVTSFHGALVTSISKSWWYLRRQETLFEKGDLFLARSEDTKKEMVDLGCAPQKIVVHYGGVDVNKFRFRKKPPDGERIKILMCGRFVEKKGFEYGIRAFAKLGKAHKSVALTLIGDGKLRGKMESLVDSLNLSPRVQFLGMLSHEEVQRQMEASDIFLSPNVTAWDGNREGIPNTIKEAMATGLPIVSTNHAGIPELVIDKKTGFLVPEKDIEGLVDRLGYLIAHPELWEKLGSQGREVVEEKFNLYKQTSRLEEIYAKLLS